MRGERILLFLFGVFLQTQGKTIVSQKRDLSELLINDLFAEFFTIDGCSNNFTDFTVETTIVSLSERSYTLSGEFTLEGEFCLTPPFPITYEGITIGAFADSLFPLGVIPPQRMELLSDLAGDCESFVTAPVAEAALQTCGFFAEALTSLTEEATELGSFFGNFTIPPTTIEDEITKGVAASVEFFSTASETFEPVNQEIFQATLETLKNSVMVAPAISGLTAEFKALQEILDSGDPAQLIGAIQIVANSYFLISGREFGEDILTPEGTGALAAKAIGFIGADVTVTQVTDLILVLLDNLLFLDLDLPPEAAELFLGVAATIDQAVAIGERPSDILPPPLRLGLEAFLSTFDPALSAGVDDFIDAVAFFAAGGDLVTLLQDPATEEFIIAFLGLNDKTLDLISIVTIVMNADQNSPAFFQDLQTIALILEVELNTVLILAEFINSLLVDFVGTVTNEIALEQLALIPEKDLDTLLNFSVDALFPLLSLFVDLGDDNLGDDDFATDFPTGAIDFGFDSLIVDGDFGTDNSTGANGVPSLFDPTELLTVEGLAFFISDMNINADLLFNLVDLGFIAGNASIFELPAVIGSLTLQEFVEFVGDETVTEITILLVTEVANQTEFALPFITVEELVNGAIDEAVRSFELQLDEAFAEAVLVIFDLESLIQVETFVADLNIEVGGFSRIDGSLVLPSIEVEGALDIAIVFDGQLVSITSDFSTSFAQAIMFFIDYTTLGNFGFGRVEALVDAPKVIEEFAQCAVATFAVSNAQAINANFVNSFESASFSENPDLFEGAIKTVVNEFLFLYSPLVTQAIKFAPKALVQDLFFFFPEGFAACEANPFFVPETPPPEEETDDDDDDGDNDNDDGEEDDGGVPIEVIAPVAIAGVVVAGCIGYFVFIGGATGAVAVGAGAAAAGSGGAAAEGGKEAAGAAKVADEEKAAKVAAAADAV